MTITAYYLTATVIDSNGVRVASTNEETIGEYSGVRYLTREAAESAREDAEELAREHYETAEVSVESEDLYGDDATDLIETVAYVSADEALAAIRRVDSSNTVIAANWAQAACPIRASWSSETEGWDSTAYQVADFRHRSEAAVWRLDDENDVSWVVSTSHDGSARVERLSR